MNIRLCIVLKIISQITIAKFCDLINNNNNNGEHLYSAFSTKLKALDTHYYPERPGINLKPSQLPGKYTVRLPVIRRLKTSILTINDLNMKFGQPVAHIM